MSDIQETGAIDWLLIEARDKEINGELVPPLLDLVDRRLIRILDVLILVKRGEGDFDTLTTADLDTDQVGELGALAGASSGLLSDDDAGEAAALMPPNSLGMLIVYENLWSVPFAVAARKAGGQLVAHGSFDSSQNSKTRAYSQRRSSPPRRPEFWRPARSRTGRNKLDVLSRATTRAMCSCSLSPGGASASDLRHVRPVSAQPSRPAGPPLASAGRTILGASGQPVVHTEARVWPMWYACT